MPASNKDEKWLCRSVEMLPGARCSTAKIIDPDNEEGYVELSVKEAGREKNWDDMKKIMEAGESLTLKTTEVNKGGLVLEYKGVKGFMPVYQLSSKNYPRVPGGNKSNQFKNPP